MPELPDDYLDLKKVVADFADNVVAPVAAQHDRDHSFPYDVVRQMGELGLFGLPFPEEIGGMGGDYFALAIALEELGRVDQSIAITLEAGVGLGIMPIHRFGTLEQQERYLPDLVAGRALAGFGLTEPGAGSDAGATSTTARLVDEEWVVNGAKQFITNSGTDITTLVTVTAVTDRRDDRAEVEQEQPEGALARLGQRDRRIGHARIGRVDADRAEDRADPGRGVLQVRPGVAGEREHPVEVEDVLRVVRHRQVRVLDAADTDLRRDPRAIGLGQVGARRVDVRPRLRDGLLDERHEPQRRPGASP